ncbi:MAG: hypothetical protein HQK73_01875 [Desulfamplus sp.]|nr:hypothetical protein [Desulfamplus sp.]MBF0413247.1 hypothetical protein [Desulfamplus sp.]
MKNRVVIRLMMIGALHTFLYLWLVPFEIYPRFGNNGFMFTILVAIVISVATIGTLFLGKKDSKKL